MTTSPQFWDKIARKYAMKPISNPLAYETTMARTQSYLAADDSVLELGCGTGSTALRLSHHVQQIIGTDVSGEMIRIAREKVDAGEGHNASFLTTRAYDLAPASAPFDTVLAFNFLHLLEDVPSALSAVSAQLRPGGYFISKSACLGGGWPLLKLAINAMQLVGKAPYVAFFTAQQLETWIRDAGFEIVETGDYPTKPQNHFVVARKQTDCV